MFVTFYSYKGGVGRTLALAHTAYCLATHKEEPCKVLIWDFDLEAPGLQKIFKCNWRGKRYGLIDLVDHYKSTRDVPPIKEYIYPTEIKGIDILPAGYQSKEYLEKFSRLSWRDIYLNDGGFSFVEGIRKQISSGKYDYVLIDSRTGYSDVSGICTLQLPDIVTLVFRLNDQNLDGIEQVHSIIRGHSKDKSGRSIEMIPVVSPRWPFSDKDENTQMKKAVEIFGEKQLSSLTFDPALNYREKIFWADKAVSQNAQIATDYKSLAARIRSHNPVDPLTIYRSAMRQADQMDYEGAIPKLKTLVKMRPDNVSYWTTLINAAISSTQLSMSTKTQDLLGEVKELIDGQLLETPENAGALLAKAIQLSEKKSPESDITEWLDKALKASPRLKHAHMMRAMIYIESGQFEKAVEDFDQLIRLDSKDARTYSLRAQCFKELGRYKEAERDLSKAIKLDGREPMYYHARARLFWRQEKYAKAEADIKIELSMRPKDESANITYCHVLVGLGRTSSAIKLLEGLNLKPTGVAGRLNLAEVWLILGEPKRSLSALSKTDPKQREPRRTIVECIKALSNIMISGKPHLTVDEIKNLAKSVRNMNVASWDWTELRLFHKRILKEQSFPPEQLEIIAQLTNALPNTTMKQAL